MRGEGREREQLLRKQWECDAEQQGQLRCLDTVSRSQRPQPSIRRRKRDKVECARDTRTQSGQALVQQWQKPAWASRDSASVALCDDLSLICATSFAAESRRISARCKSAQILTCCSWEIVVPQCKGPSTVSGGATRCCTPR